MARAAAMAARDRDITVGVLALQGAFDEHIQLLRQAGKILTSGGGCQNNWSFVQVRNQTELASCDALIIPGGESTAISLVAERSNMLEPLRDFVKKLRRPTWGTCAGLILLAESANRTMKGGQELIGGLDVRVNRNYFGRQIESFEAYLDLPFLQEIDETGKTVAGEPFKAIFIRAPIVEKILPNIIGEQEGEAKLEDSVIAPSREKGSIHSPNLIAPVEIMGILTGRTSTLKADDMKHKLDTKAGDIIAVRQTNVFGTSFHPELTGDPRIHIWWLEQVVEAVSNQTTAIKT